MVIESMLCQSDEVLRFVLLQRIGLDGDLEGKDRTASLANISTLTIANEGDISPFPLPIASSHRGEDLRDR